MNWQLDARFESVEDIGRSVGGQMTEWVVGIRKKEWLARGMEQLMGE